MVFTAPGLSLSWKTVTWVQTQLIMEEAWSGPKSEGPRGWGLGEEEEPHPALPQERRLCGQQHELGVVQSRSTLASHGSSGVLCCLQMPEEQPWAWGGASAVCPSG